MCSERCVKITQKCIIEIFIFNDSQFQLFASIIRCLINAEHIVEQDVIQVSWNFKISFHHSILSSFTEYAKENFDF